MLEQFSCYRLLLCLWVTLIGVTVRADETIPADPSPRWWKGNLHTHTLWSDGDDFPEMVAEWYRTRGYHFLALTDHNVMAQGMRWMKASAIESRGSATVLSKYEQRFGHSWVETRGAGADREYRLKPLDEFRALVEQRGVFLLIPAEEISDSAEGVPVHINASNIRDTLAPVGGTTVVESITNNLRAAQDQAARSGREILAHLNHPNFQYAITAEDIAQAVIERHFEVYNGHPGVNHRGDAHHPGTERLWDIANTIRLVELHAPPLYGIATDDSHAYHGQANAASPGRGWTMVRATHLTPEHIIKGLKAGDCYASSGVTLRSVRFDAQTRTLRLEIEPDGDATFTTEFIGSPNGINASGTPLPTTGPNQGRFTKIYSDQIGKVFATTQGLAPEYQLTGNELYVRAVVTSSKRPENPAFEGQRQQAWTQPVGWSVSAPGQSADR